uniref:Uncharacterized protein n=1 Tax=Oryza sativa subsp. japonica TaxID=39947 RepID=Q6YUZ8_ORYSJ|nr:hypothetical protein [Oryza sativa Japonica Group]BAD25057.1 hypothetical protein [Oryza sativa Japonica Group]
MAGWRGRKDDSGGASRQPARAARGVTLGGGGSNHQIHTASAGSGGVAAGSEEGIVNSGGDGDDDGNVSAARGGGDGDSDGDGGSGGDRRSGGRALGFGTPTPDPTGGGTSVPAQPGKRMAQPETRGDGRDSRQPTGGAARPGWPAGAGGGSAHTEAAARPERLAVTVGSQRKEERQMAGLLVAVEVARVEVARVVAQLATAEVGEVRPVVAAVRGGEAEVLVQHNEACWCGDGGRRNEWRPARYWCDSVVSACETG